MRDNTLAIELHKAGKDVTILPMYLPLMLDEEPLEGLKATPVFFGGINVFLQSKLSLFRKTPAFLDKLFNFNGLLRFAARNSHITSARTHGEMCLDMLNIEDSGFKKEFEKLLTWLEDIEKPDVVCLSTALQAGLADEIKKRLGVPVILFFQGEDSFLDGLPEPFKAQCWERMSERLSSLDILVSPSHFYSKYMEQRLGFSVGKIAVMPNGIKLEGFVKSGRPPECPTIGYLARMCSDKGLDVLVDAYIRLRTELGNSETRLKVAGAMPVGDAVLVNELKKKIKEAGLENDVHWFPNISREDKISFLQSLTLFSVPVAYPEAFGLYLIEAIACGVPVVQPDKASFTEIVDTTGGGLCYKGSGPNALADSWNSLLSDPARRNTMSETGRKQVEAHYTSTQMSQNFLDLSRSLAPSVS